MRTLVSIPLREIQLSNSRPTVPETVNSLADSMRVAGLINPVTVKCEAAYNGAIMVDGYKIVVGNHRVSAARALGWEAIDAFITDDSSLEDELRAIDENLIRAELTPAQRALALKRRKEIHGALYPETRRGGDRRSDQTDKLSVRNDSFDRATAKATGVDARTVRREVARAEALGDDIEEVVGTSLDKGTELDALAKMDPEDRPPLIAAAKAGEKVTAIGRDELTRNVRLARQMISELNRCAQHMDDAEFAEALSGIEITAQAKRIAKAVLTYSGATAAA